MTSALGLVARPAVLVPPPTRLSSSDMSSRSDPEPCDLCAGCLGKLGRRKGDDRHRADRDPGNWNARDVLPRQTTIRTSGSSSANDRVHIAQSRNRIANRRILGHTGLSEVSHAVLEMVLKLPDEAAALQPSAAQRPRQSGQELSSGVAANLQPPRARVQIQNRSRHSGAASSQTARGGHSGSSVTRRRRACAGRRPSPNGCVPALVSPACAAPDTAFPQEPQARHPNEHAARTRWHTRAGGPVEESPTKDPPAVLGNSAYLDSRCIDSRGVKSKSRLLRVGGLHEAATAASSARVEPRPAGRRQRPGSRRVRGRATSARSPAVRMEGRSS